MNDQHLAPNDLAHIRQQDDRLITQHACRLLQAIVGAVYYDGGYSAVEAFVLQEVVPRLKEAIANGPLADPTTALELLFNKTTGDSPEYKNLADRKDGQNRLCVVGVFYGDQKLCEGAALQRQTALRRATRQLLRERFGVVTETDLRRELEA